MLWCGMNWEKSGKTERAKKSKEAWKDFESIRLGCEDENSHGVWSGVDLKVEIDCWKHNLESQAQVILACFIMDFVVLCITGRPSVARLDGYNCSRCTFLYVPKLKTCKGRMKFIFLLFFFFSSSSSSFTISAVAVDVEWSSTHI